jgi:hypothetical protein
MDKKTTFLLIALAVLLIAASYWWGTQQTPEPESAQPESAAPTGTPNIQPPTTPPPSNTTDRLPEPITIPIDQLPEGQQTVLRTLGIDGETITFTPEMVACAEAEIGAARLDEIIAGDTPSFGEGFTLVNCYRK